MIQGIPFGSSSGIVNEKNNIEAQGEGTAVDTESPEQGSSFLPLLMQMLQFVSAESAEHQMGEERVEDPFPSWSPVNLPCRLPERIQRDITTDFEEAVPQRNHDLPSPHLRPEESDLFSGQDLLPVNTPPISRRPRDLSSVVSSVQSFQEDPVPSFDSHQTLRPQGMEKENSFTSPPLRTPDNGMTRSERSTSVVKPPLDVEGSAIDLEEARKPLQQRMVAREVMDIEDPPVRSGGVSGRSFMSHQTSDVKVQNEVVSPEMKSQLNDKGSIPERDPSTIISHSSSKQEPARRSSGQERKVPSLAQQVESADPRVFARGTEKPEAARRTELPDQPEPKIAVKMDAEGQELERSTTPRLNELEKSENLGEVKELSIRGKQEPGDGVKPQTDGDKKALTRPSLTEPTSALGHENRQRASTDGGKNMSFASPERGAQTTHVSTSLGIGEDVPLSFESSRVVIDQIANKIVSLKRENSTELHLTLKPEKLGEVTMRMKMENGSLTARIEVSQPTVKHALDASIPQIRESLVEKGIEVHRIEIGWRGDSPGSEPGTQKESRKHPRQRENAATEERLASGRSLGYNTMEITL